MVLEAEPTLYKSVGDDGCFSVTETFQHDESAGSPTWVSVQ